MVEEGEETDDLADWDQEIIKEAEAIVGTDDYIRLPDPFEINEYQIMMDFCYSVESDRLKDELLDKIHGSGAFRRFKDTIYRRGVEKQWYDYRQKAFNEIAINWLNTHGFAYTTERNAE